MENKLSTNLFYVYNIIFYTCLLTSSLSATIDTTNQSMSIEPIENKTQEEESMSWFEAAEEGNLEIAKQLKQQGANPQAKDEDENNALHLVCAASDNEEMVTWLLDTCKVDLESKGFNQKTPFLCAVQTGQLGIAKLLKQKGANIHAKSKSGNNALHEACLFSGSKAIVTWLLDVCNIGIETIGQCKITPFLCAVVGGNLEIAKLLKDRGADINAKNHFGNNALHFACLWSKSVPMVTWLLDICKIDIETKGRDKTTPFLCAVERGQLGIAKLLKDRGADINAKNNLGNNALHLACLWSKSVPMVTWLLDMCKIDIETKGRDERTPFLCATESGQLSIAKLLKLQGANIHAKTKSKNNALHMACLWSKSVPMITWLLDTCEIDIETKGNYEETPLFKAAGNRNFEIVLLLLERGANPPYTEEKDGGKALKWASSNPQVTDFLKVFKPDPNAPSQTDKNSVNRKNDLLVFGYIREFYQANNKFIPLELQNLCLKYYHMRRPPSYYAESYFFEKIINCKSATDLEALKTCLKYYILENIRDKCKYTPFLIAACHGKLEVAQMLKKWGADVNAKNNYEDNALHLACLCSKSVDMVTWLLDVCKIGIETTEQNQMTPFLFAAEKGQLEIAKLLKKRNANINAKSKDGNNALHLACLCSKSVDMVTWLLDECKIDIESKGQNQMTPFLFAALGDKVAIAKLLKDRDANTKAKDKYGNKALGLAKKYKKHYMYAHLRSDKKLRIVEKFHKLMAVLNK